MQQIEPLVHGKYFHIFNRGTNSCNLFAESANYKHFLELYDKYIPQVAETYAWVLMKNHFHVIVRIKEEEEIGLIPDPPTLSSSSKTHSPVEDPKSFFAPKRYNPSNQFSHLFNSYCQYFNKWTHRTGSLFEHPFHRKRVDELVYFKRLVRYIHNNPVHHKITEFAMDYPWSSYLTCLSLKPTQVKRDAVMGWFDNQANFISVHGEEDDIVDLENWLGL
jgi:putative transposase